MYLEDLAVKCVSCVYACVVAVTGFFFLVFFLLNTGKKLQHSQRFGCVCRVRALEATVMFGRV